MQQQFGVLRVGSPPKATFPPQEIRPLLQDYLRDNQPFILQGLAGGTLTQSLRLIGIPNLWPSKKPTKLGTLGGRFNEKT